MSVIKQSGTYRLKHSVTLRSFWKLETEEVEPNNIARRFLNEGEATPYRLPSQGFYKITHDLECTKRVGECNNKSIVPHLKLSIKIGRNGMKRTLWIQILNKNRYISKLYSNLNVVIVYHFWNITLVVSARLIFF